MAYTDLLKEKLAKEDYEKLFAIDNQKLHEFIAEYVSLCKPDRVFIRSDLEKDMEFVRGKALDDGEERNLALKGHTIHFDGFHDQARDKEHTKFLVSKGEDLGPLIHSMDKEEGTREVKDILDGSMVGHTMYVGFFILGPEGSKYSLPVVQITDSSYVMHSEDLLYRNGYQTFLKSDESSRFFRFVHSVAELDYSKRRIYIDVDDEITYSTNTEYGGNTIGLKKLALRLAIKRASCEGWLAEHMFIVGISGPGGRKTYLTGAYPSGCGKTSTSMMDGESIIGDDLVYLHKTKDEVRAVNPERGVFGIINDITSREEPILWDTLNNEGEIIFSNVLVGADNMPYWSSKDGVHPKKGFNFSGDWFEGKIDEDGNEIPISHKNSRFTFKIELLRNRDENLENPEGVKVGGIIYGGRDSDTSVPVQESFNWLHGIVSMGASLESETTAATLGEVGIRKFNPMSNLDFISISVGEYIKNNIVFGSGLANPPPIYSVNYFLKDDRGRFLNDKRDKKVWLRWMELRAHREAEAIKTPTGMIPSYIDLRNLFREVLGKNYPREDYIEQFTIRVSENLSKIDRIVNIYREKIPSTPPEVFRVLDEQKQRLIAARKQYGDYITPDKLGG